MKARVNAIFLASAVRDVTFMGSAEPERLPPPPFWRTRYFAFDILARRDYLYPIEIRGS